MKLILIITAVFIFSSSLAQKKDTRYLFFDNDSEEFITYEVGDGTLAKEKKYRKEKKDNGDIYFLIEKEQLIYKKGKKVDICSISFLEGLQLNTPQELKTSLPKEYIYYPYKYYNNLVIVEKISETELLCYPVKWEFVIE